MRCRSSPVAHQRLSYGPQSHPRLRPDPKRDRVPELERSFVWASQAPLPLPPMLRGQSCENPMAAPECRVMYVP